MSSMDLQGENPHDGVSTDLGSPEQRLAEVRKQVDIVRRQLEARGEYSACADAAEIEARVDELLGDVAGGGE